MHSNKDFKGFFFVFYWFFLGHFLLSLFGLKKDSISWWVWIKRGHFFLVNH